MSDADDRLIGVVGIEMEPSAGEDAGQNIPGGGDALAVLAANPDREIYFGKFCHLVIERCNLLRETAPGKCKHREILPTSIRFVSVLMTGPAPSPSAYIHRKHGRRVACIR